MSESRKPLYGGQDFEYESGIRLLKNIFPGDAIDCVKTLSLETEDVVVATYAKAGTTWVQEIASQIVQRDASAADAGADLNLSISQRFCHIEAGAAFPGMKTGIETLVEKPHPWLMKTHLPARIFQKQLSEGKARFIVVMRNVKDNLVSYYHFHKAITRWQFSGTWDDFFEYFKAKELLWGDWLEHNLSWWACKDHPNVLIVKYEDLKKNRREVIEKVAQFLEKPLSEEVLDRITESTSFENMKSNSATNLEEWHPHIMNFDVSPFMRKGVVGDWKNYFSDEQNAYVEEQ